MKRAGRIVGATVLVLGALFALSMMIAPYPVSSFESVRAVSRIAAQPLALSLAPGRGWSRWQLQTISSPASAGSAPGIVAVGMA